MKFMEQKSVKNRSYFFLLALLILLLFTSASAVSAATVTYRWTPSSGVSVATGLSTDWGSCDVRPSSFVTTILSTANSAGCDSDRHGSAALDPATDMFYNTAYTQNTNVQGNWYFGRLRDSSGGGGTFIFKLIYVYPNGTIAVLPGSASQSVTSGQSANFNVSLSGISGTVPAGAKLGLRLSKSGSSGSLRAYVGDTAALGNIPSGYFSVTETPAVSAPIIYIPPSPTSLSSTSGNFWINYTWSAGSGNVTNSYNVSVNGIWTNSSSNSFKNTSVGPHGWSNITIYAFNSTGTLSATPLSRNTQVANNPVSIGNVSGSYTIAAGNTLSIYPNSSDQDGDTPVFNRNFTNGTFYTNNGTLIWTTASSDTGIHSWQINVTDGYGSVSQTNFTVNVTPRYSLNITYNFTETIPNSLWQSISIKDNSSGDTLTNVSILNATSDIWESILTTPFVGGASPIEHVNVIKGASGNASSYDTGGGMIKIRYNWTNSTVYNNLGIDLIDVTVSYIKTIYLLDTTSVTIDVPESNSSVLQLKYNVSGDNFTTQVMNTSSGWENVTILNNTFMPYRNITLNSNWLIPNGTVLGNTSAINRYDVFIRYLGINQSVNGTINLDYQRVYSS
ncbi:MAG: hypothetical protein OIN87_04420 [Candidatus Methanoperedens sp.]|nr:hypothetical protein [Candidatus Methanoperedens sp.]